MVFGAELLLGFDVFFAVFFVLFFLLLFFAMLFVLGALVVVEVLGVEVWLCACAT